MPRQKLRPLKLERARLWDALTGHVDECEACEHLGRRESAGVPGCPRAVELESAYLDAELAVEEWRRAWDARPVSPARAARVR